jgi:hypothetical protein
MGRTEVWNRTFAEIFGKLPKRTGLPRRIRPVADWQPVLPSTVHMPLHDLSNAASTACCDMTGTGCAGETRVS